ncbi:MAG: cytochrome c3 family protein [Gemmatimonadota bacterium]
MKALRLLLLVPALGLSGLIATAVWATVRADEGFPHAKHEGLFPLCQTCHSGIESGSVADVYPSSGSCQQCHDGQREEAVPWTGPSQRGTNLSFSHVEHFAATSDEAEPVTCQTCHALPGGEGRMAVDRADPDGCLTCHAHEADEHFAPARDCASCHVPLARAHELAVAQIDSLPKPATHEVPDFASQHGAAWEAAQGSCAFCHTRDSCERCHFNGAGVPAVAALERDPRVASLVAGRDASYPEPATHETGSWGWTHGESALADVGSCSNCHTRPSCETCHAGGASLAIASLPVLGDGDTRGVQIAMVSRQVHDPGFATAHGVEAASMESTCAGCHQESFCSSCHAGSSTPSFHTGNFLQGHGAEAYGREYDCASCHNTETFCRSCHADVGLQSSGRLATAFHSSRPMWLLGHGEAARQGLESCTTCHRQSDCMRCHAAVGAWRINPHGPGFDPSKMGDANPSMCVACHRTGIPR